MRRQIQCELKVFCRNKWHAKASRDSEWGKWGDGGGNEHYIDIHEAATQIDELTESSVLRTSRRDFSTQVRPIEANNVIKLVGIEIKEAVTGID